MKFVAVMDALMLGSLFFGIGKYSFPRDSKKWFAWERASIYLILIAFLIASIDGAIRRSF